MTLFVDKPKLILPFIVYEFLLLLLWVAVEVRTINNGYINHSLIAKVMVVLVLAVYLTTSVDITTTVR